MIEQKRYLYEVLIRGTHDGQIAGAHQIHAERVANTETGAVHSDTAGVAAPLEVAAVGPLLGEAFAGSARQITDLLAAKADLETKLVDARREVDRLTAIISAASSVPPTATDPGAVPASVSAFQARAALFAAGLLDDVEAAVAAADRLTRIAWESAQAFERGSPTIATLAAALGLSDEQLDDLFRAAAEIRA